MPSSTKKNGVTAHSGDATATENRVVKQCPPEVPRNETAESGGCCLNSIDQHTGCWNASASHRFRF
jgi:hypothetical protein